MLLMVRCFRSRDLDFGPRFANRQLNFIYFKLRNSLPFLYHSAYQGSNGAPLRHIF